MVEGKMRFPLGFGAHALDKGLVADFIGVNYYTRDMVRFTPRITSYNVCYTKLLRCNLLDAFIEAGKLPTATDSALLAGRIFHTLLGYAHRITSYNVCYTKLLRGSAG